MQSTGGSHCCGLTSGEEDRRTAQARQPRRQAFLIHNHCDLAYDHCYVYWFWEQRWREQCWRGRTVIVEIL
jgi:hypothetical protein